MTAGTTTASSANARVFDVPCILDIEVSAESVHAHAIPEGVTLYPGDTVLVHDAPDHVAFGERITRRCTATVTRAGWLTRQWTRLVAIGQVTELYEVSFAPLEER
jgi:hypothetical protein